METIGLIAQTPGCKNTKKQLSLYARHYLVYANGQCLCANSDKLLQQLRRSGKNRQVFFIGFEDKVSYLYVGYCK